MKPFKIKLKEFEQSFADEFPYLDNDNFENSKMFKYFGTEVTVTEQVEDDCVMIAEDGREFMWLWDWFEK